MTKKKKFPLKSVIIGSLLSILFLGVLAVGANLSFMDRIADKAGEILGLNLSDQIKIDMPEETFGGSGGVFQTDWYKVGNRVTWVKSGQFTDATTTIVAFLNPVDYGKATSTSDVTYNKATHEVSTSTVMSVNLDITGVSTSSANILCGASSDQYTSPTYHLLSATLATSTPGVINNNATSTVSYGIISGGDTPKILLTHDYPYFVCRVSNVGDAADLTGFTGKANTFDGYWSVEIIKNLQ